MSVYVDVSVKGARHHQALDKVLEQKVGKLERVCSALKACKIVISTKKKALHLTQFRVDMVCFIQNSKKTLTVKTEGQEHLSLAVTDAFKSLKSQLKKQASKKGVSYRRHLSAAEKDRRRWED